MDPDDPKFENLGDMRATPGWKDIFYPIVLHGDGIEFTKKNNNSLLVLSWKSLLAFGFDWAVMLLTCIPKCCRCMGTKDGCDTMYQIWEYIVCFFNSAFHGQRPLADPWGRDWPTNSIERAKRGEPWCGGRVRLVVWGFTGDLEYVGIFESRYEIRGGSLYNFRLRV